MRSLQAVVAVCCGFLTFLSAYHDVDWFMNHHKARFFVKLLGRSGARMFYMILGIILIGLSIYLAISGAP